MESRETGKRDPHPGGPEKKHLLDSQVAESAAGLQTETLTHGYSKKNLSTIPFRRESTPSIEQFRQTPPFPQGGVFNI